MPILKHLEAITTTVSKTKIRKSKLKLILKRVRSNPVDTPKIAMLTPAKTSANTANNKNKVFNLSTSSSEKQHDSFTSDWLNLMNKHPLIKKLQIDIKTDDQKSLYARHISDLTTSIIYNLGINLKLSVDKVYGSSADV